MKTPEETLEYIRIRRIELNKALEEGRDFLVYSRDTHGIDLRESFGITLRRIQSKKSELKHLEDFINGTN